MQAGANAVKKIVSSRLQNSLLTSATNPLTKQMSPYNKSHILEFQRVVHGNRRSMTAAAPGSHDEPNSEHHSNHHHGEENMDPQTKAELAMMMPFHWFANLRVYLPPAWVMLLLTFLEEYYRRNYK